MRCRTLLLSILLVVAGIPLAVLAADDPPPVFERLSFARAKEKAEAETRLLVVKATAKWCGPCRLMDRTTWRDERVVEWIGKHALAIQVDIDEQPKTARGLAIEAVPTMIVFKGERELDRIVGHRDAAGLLQWLDDVRSGKTVSDVLREKAGERAGPDGRVDVRSRVEVARALAESNRLDEAAAEYLWLWDNMLEQDRRSYEARHSSMAEGMQALAAKHDPAREAFNALREGCEQRLAVEPGLIEVRADWVTLNAVLDEQVRTLEWFDAAKTDPKQARALERVEREIARALIVAGRWADLGRWIREPMRRVQRAYWLHAAMGAAGAPENGKGEVQLRIWREEIGTLYAALLAAGREPEAQTILEQAMRSVPDAGTRVRAVERAIDAGQARPEHVQWAREAEANGDAEEGLTERAREAMGKQSEPE